MNRFCDVLRFLRKKHNLTQGELANVLNMSKSTISMYENGNRLPSFEVLEAFADYFNVSVGVLRGEPENSTTRIPVAGSVKAGIPTEAITDIVDWEEISPEMARRGDFVGLKVSGSSMLPRFCDGDTVIVRRQPDVESGEIAIVFVNGDEATMKKVIKTPDGIMLIALNSAVYEPHFYSKQQIVEMPVTIYGKVVELRGKF